MVTFLNKTSLRSYAIHSKAGFFHMNGTPCVKTDVNAVLLSKLSGPLTSIDVFVKAEGLLSQLHERAG